MGSDKHPAKKSAGQRFNAPGGGRGRTEKKSGMRQWFSCTGISAGPINCATHRCTNSPVQLKDETVRLAQDQMAMLFGKTKSTINEHIKNIYA
jgi:hypothetical protein